MPATSGEAGTSASLGFVGMGCSLQMPTNWVSRESGLAAIPTAFPSCLVDCVPGDLIEPDCALKNSVASVSVPLTWLSVRSAISRWNVSRVQNRSGRTDWAVRKNQGPAEARAGRSP